MKVWHDDIRYPPDDSWEWAKTNDEAVALLKTGEVEFISIDMDLGAIEGKDFLRGKDGRSVQWLRNMNNDPGENGLGLVAWMVENKIVPDRVVVHTWSSWGSQAMIDCFHEGGYKHIEREFWSDASHHQQRVYGVTA